jgi:hypothetical protein
MFKIMDSEKLFIPVKSGFPTAAKAFDWAKKNLPKDSCRPWRLWIPADRSKKYFIQKY